MVITQQRKQVIALLQVSKFINMILHTLSLKLFLHPFFYLPLYHHQIHYHIRTLILVEYKLFNHRILTFFLFYSKDLPLEVNLLLLGLAQQLLVVLQLVILVQVGLKLVLQLHLRLFLILVVQQVHHLSLIP